MRDINSDTSSNKITVAVKLGRKRAKQYHLFLIIGAIILTAIFGLLYYRKVYNLAFFIAYIPLVKHVIFVIKNKEPKLLDSQLKVLALATFFLSLLLGLGQIFHIL